MVQKGVYSKPENLVLCHCRFCKRGVSSPGGTVKLMEDQAHALHPDSTPGFVNETADFLLENRKKKDE